MENATKTYWQSELCKNTIKVIQFMIKKLEKWSNEYSTDIIIEVLEQAGVQRCYGVTP